MVLVISCVCCLYGILQYMQMGTELKSALPDSKFVWWHLFIPIYGYYVGWILLPAEVARAKQALGIQKPPQNIVLYILLGPFAFATDMNDIAQRLGAAPAQ